jgi:hypothetical protein
MGFTSIDIVNLIAMSINIMGAYLMFYFTPPINSQIYTYNRSEMPAKRKEDARKNKWQRGGMFLIFIGFLLQAIALFLSIAGKK